MINIKSVAVLISTFNGGKYIAQQLESLREQKGDFKLYVYIRDDGSKDNTTSVVNSFKSKFNNLIFFKDKNNLGVGKSFLTLLKRCGKHDYYFFCDQDDVWKNNKIKKAISFLGNTHNNIPEIYFSNADVVNSVLKKEGSVYSRTPPTDYYTVLSYGGILGCTVCFNYELKKLITQKEIPNKLVMHDFYVSTICLLFGGKIYYDNSRTLLYRQHGDNSIGVKYRMIDKFKQALAYLVKPVRCKVADQLQTILRLYGDNFEVSKEKRSWFFFLFKTKENLLNRIIFIFKDRTTYDSCYKKIFTHLSILLGNY